jgi:hypothetical protein
MKSIWRRGEGVEPSGNNISRQAGFEDRWGHRAPSSSVPCLLGAYGDPRNLGRLAEKLKQTPLR